MKYPLKQLLPLLALIVSLSSSELYAQKKGKEKNKAEQAPTIASPPQIRTGSTSLSAPAAPTTPEEEAWRKASRKLRETLDIVSTNYMDNVDPKKASEDAIKGMLEELDPHSVYIPAEEYKKVSEPLMGNFDGIGVQFNIIKDTIVVLNTIGGGPSEKLGILAGDKIVNIDGQSVAGIKITNDDVTKRLRGPRNSKVNVGIKRPGEAQLLDFVIVRDKIPIYSVEASYMASPQVGYIKLNRFAATSADEVATAITKLKLSGMQDLILDLRGNGGGFLEVAFQLTSLFFPRGKLLVYTEGRKSSRRDYTSMGEGLFRNGKLVILIDEGSASASEILAGAIQDWDRGLLIGRRSFGKGLVQRPFELSDSSVIRLTVAHYYTPSGRCIQRPYSEGKDAYRKEAADKNYSHSLTDIEKAQLPDSLKFYTLRQKRLVLGGGGITPDIALPLDTTINYIYFNEMQRKNVLNQFMVAYVNDHRNELLTQYPTVAEFKQQYTLPDQLWKQIIAAATKEGIEDKKPENTTAALPAYKELLKALMARYIWDADAYQQIENETDPVYKKALEALKNNTLENLKLSGE